MENPTPTLFIPEADIIKAPKARNNTGTSEDQNKDAYDFTANQIAIATMAKTITAHTAGVTCFELPLRGESLAA
jgi:hypothetical protein